MKNRNVMKTTISALVLLFVNQFAHAQIAVNQLTDTLTEDFNSLAETGTQNTWTQNSTLLGWYGYRVANQLPVTLYRADDGSANSGGLYSYGVDADRALGSLASGSTGTMVFGLRMKNQTGNTITSVTVSYTAEQWRVASTVPNFLKCFYKIDATLDGLNPDELTNKTGYISVADLDVESVKLNGTATKLDGNLPENKKQFSATINVVWKAGEELFFRWDDDDQQGSDHGLALDDLRISFSNVDNAAPEVLQAQFVSANLLEVKFNEPVNQNDATNVSNFTLNPPLQITAAKYNAANYSVALTVQAQLGSFYNVEVKQIKDSASVPNTLVSASIQQIVFNDFDGKDLFLTEIMYDNPGADFLEFVELFNASANPIPMGGLRFTQGLELVLPEFDLMPDSFVVLSRTKDSFEFYFQVPSIEWQGGALGNFTANTTIVLENTIAEKIMDITYQTAGEWPASAQGGGPSLEFLNLAKNPNSGNSWSPANVLACVFRNDSVFATPGYAMFKNDPVDTTLSFLNVNNKEWRVYPVPFENQLTIYFGDLDLGISKTITMYNLWNQKVAEMKQNDKELHIEMDTHLLLPGVYFVEVKTNHKIWYKKVIQE